MKTKLSVNIDHVATLRQARGTSYPDPVSAAVICELAGAHGITIHLREDRRHIQERDLEVLTKTCQTHLNLECACTAEMIDFALNYKPSLVTFVPEKREELTTEGGLDVIGNFDLIKNAIANLNGKGIPSSLFIDCDLDQIGAAKKSGAKMIELHTGPYAHNSGPSELDRLQKAASSASRMGLMVAAGHGLTEKNVSAVSKISEIQELNIGHGLVSLAVFVGLKEAVQIYLSEM